MTSGVFSIEEGLGASESMDLALAAYGQAKKESYSAEQHRREMMYDLQESINNLAEEGYAFDVAGDIDHWRIKLPSGEEVEDSPTGGSWGSFNGCVIDAVCDRDRPHSNLLVRAFVSAEATAILYIDNVRLLAVSDVQPVLNSLECNIE